METGAVIGAIVLAISSAIVGYFTLRASVRATEAKKKTDDNAAVLEAWRELVQPLREENARLVAQITQERVRHETERAEDRAVIAALSKQNEELHTQARRKKP